MKTLSENLDYGVHIVLADKTTYVYNGAIASFERASSEDESTLLKVLRTGEPTINVEQKYLNKYGKTINTVNSTVPVFGEGQKVVAAIELSKNIMDIKELSDSIELAKRTAGNSTSLESYMKNLEKDIITESMRSCNGNISKAAEHLGIKRQTLQHKLKKYGIVRGEGYAEEGDGQK